MQAMCQVYAAVSYICIGDVESSSQVQFFYMFYIFVNNKCFHFEKKSSLDMLGKIFFFNVIRNLLFTILIVLFHS